MTVPVKIQALLLKAIEKYAFDSSKESKGNRRSAREPTLG